MLAKVEYLDSLDLRTATYTRHYNDGTEIKADLIEGTESAFAVVKIKDEVITTEMPNLTLRLFRQMAPRKKRKCSKGRCEEQGQRQGQSKEKGEGGVQRKGSWQGSREGWEGSEALKTRFVRRW